MGVGRRFLGKEATVHLQFVCKILTMNTSLKAILLLILSFPLFLPELAAQNQSRMKPEQVFDFGKVGDEAAVEHTFSFLNSGPETLEVKNVQLSPPLTATKITARIAPGETGSITIHLGTPRNKGEFQGGVLVYFKNEGIGPKLFSVQGEIVNPIEFEPRAAFFVAVQQGQSKEASIEIINHESDPLQILRAENPSPRFTTELETVEEGKRFRLTLKMNPDAPAGKATDVITVVTSSNQHPFLEVQANIWVKDRVYTFPDILDFGQIQTQQLKTRPQLVSFLSQTLMVYQVGGKDFQMSASTDVPFLQLSPVRSKFQDRYQIEVAVIPEKLKAGSADGSILITTNDPEFPRLTVPVKAVVEGSW